MSGSKNSTGKFNNLHKMNTQKSQSSLAANGLRITSARQDIVGSSQHFSGNLTTKNSTLNNSSSSSHFKSKLQSKYGINA